MDLLRDEPDWTFTGFPGFGAHHLRVWRAPTGILVAVITEVVDDQEYNIAGTDLLEGHILVLSQLEAEHPGEIIDYILCTRRLQLDWDAFTRIELHGNGTEHHIGLTGNHVIDHLGAHGMYRRGAGPGHLLTAPSLTPDDQRRMPGC